MREITIYPIEVLQGVQYCALIIGAISFLMAIILKAYEIKILANLILICSVIGGGAAMVRYNLQCKQTHATVFAELPVEWVEFSKSLAGLKRSDLRYEAIKRFTRSNPPRLTTENYAALLGLKLWSCSRTRVHNSFITASRLLDDLVILDFAEKRNP